MVDSNPWKSLFRLISFEGVFQSSQLISKFKTQEMRKGTLSQDEILELSLGRKHRRAQMRIQYERLAQHQRLIEAEIEAERINH
jgi:hypothetical protein